jgi:hypothetical protein
VTRRKICALLLTLTLTILAVVPATALADGSEVPIIPWIPDQDWHIYPGDQGVVRSGWGACSPGLVKAWIRASNYVFTLEVEGEQPFLTLTPEEIDQLWGPIEPFVFSPDVCVAGRKPSSAVWRYELGTLDAGRYVLRYSHWVDHQLIDGADYDGDGKPDMFTPASLQRVRAHTIIVHE